MPPDVMSEGMQGMAERNKGRQVGQFPSAEERQGARKEQCKVVVCCVNDGGVSATAEVG